MRCFVVHYLTGLAVFTSFVTDEAGSMTGEIREALEVSGPSHRIGLSGANKTMLHLLKKAKVQLIKIDQQKQLKLSQVMISDQICAQVEKKGCKKLLNQPGIHDCIMCVKMSQNKSTVGQTYNPLSSQQIKAAS